ncbi:MAG: hypothetical protein B6247_17425 [Candidatus Parabeggiatoa sp. nov. 2]|nr:MAG: hypothetical protein B6247_17425 [Beggiatoa sp. 4572_84]
MAVFFSLRAINKTKPYQFANLAHKLETFNVLETLAVFFGLRAINKTKAYQFDNLAHKLETSNVQNLYQSLYGTFAFRQTTLSRYARNNVHCMSGSSALKTKVQSVVQTNVWQSSVVQTNVWQKSVWQSSKFF